MDLQKILIDSSAVYASFIKYFNPEKRFKQQSSDFTENTLFAHNDPYASPIPLARLDSSQIRDIVFAYQTIRELCHWLYYPLLKSSRKGIKKAEEKWNNFLTNSMYQYPWEAWFNGLFYKSNIVSPPQTQFLLFHFSYGVEILQLNSLTDIKAKNVISIYPIGIVRYLNYKYKSYLGVSTMLNIRDDVPIGFGAFATYSGFNIGCVWHQDSVKATTFKPYLSLSVNLLKFVNSVGGIYSKNRNLLKKLKGN